MRAVTDFQKTVARPAELAGVGLFYGETVRMRCLPAPPDHGVRFVRTDLPGSKGIRATTDSVMGKSRWIILAEGEAEVHMVEHLLAVLNGLGVDNVTVELSARELPVGDGSAKAFVEMIKSAGLVDQAKPRARLVLEEPVYVVENDSAIVALPSESGLHVSCTLDYGGRFAGVQHFGAKITPELFEAELAPSRTYVLSTEIDAFLQKGLGGGANPDNVVVLSEDGGTSLPLRYPNEFVRHKALDLIGDLSLVGAPLQARVIAVKSGHAMNVELARLIRSGKGALPPREG